MSEKEALPRPLLGYLLAIGFAGPAVALAALAAPGGERRDVLLPALLLTVLAAVADRFRST